MDISIQQTSSERKPEKKFLLTTNSKTHKNISVHRHILVCLSSGHCSVIFVLTYFLVLVLVAVFEIFFSFSFVLVFIIFSF